MATYSAFFSSGLLAPRIARCTTPVPIAISEPIDRQLSPTPTPHGQMSPRPKAPNAERPRMRKRRSSFNIGASPMAIIRSPVRNAGAALQRTGLMSPTRHRAATVSMNGASENNSLFGRLRSGSMGGIPQAAKRIRRMIRPLNPLLPPPSAPLPALPTSPNAKSALLVAVPRHTDNAGNLISPTPPSAIMLSPDYTPKMPFKLLSDLPSPQEDAADDAMDEN